jgi:glyoxylase-like metal-dependent hydrolase (beta-lactamase superfamily II)
MSKGEATWPATSVSLITGERDAVLINAALTTQDAEHIVKWIEATRKNLTTVYITHSHGDHFFGLNPILSAFPEARAVTAAAMVPETQGQHNNRERARPRIVRTQLGRHGNDGPFGTITDISRLRTVSMTRPGEPNGPWYTHWLTHLICVLA